MCLFKNIGIGRTSVAIVAVAIGVMGVSSQAWAVSSACSSLKSSPFSGSVNDGASSVSGVYTLDVGEVLEITTSYTDATITWKFGPGGPYTVSSKPQITAVGGGGNVSTITVNNTAGGTGTAVTFSVTCVTSDDTSASFTNLYGSISRSQSAIIGRNVDARIASAFDSGDENTQQSSSTGFAPTLGFSQTNLTGDRPGSRGTSIRELAMLASFDTSRMVFAAAGDQQDPFKGVQDRSGLSSNQPYTVWGNGSFTSVDNTRNRTNDDSRMNGDVWGYNLGVDYRYRPELVTGVSLGYSQTNLTTTFNSGTYDETNWTISPYAMYQPMDGVTVSAIAGYSIGNVDRTRDTTVTGNTDSGVWFASLNGDYKIRPSAEKPLDITARIAVLVSRKTVDAFTESDGTDVAKSTTDTRQLKPGLEAAYSFDAQGTALQPFVKADYVHDFTDATNGDKGAFNLGGGLRIASGKTGLSGSIEGERMVGRNDYKEYTVSGLIAYSFDIGGNGAGQLGIASPYVKTNFNTTANDGQSGSQVYGTGIKFISDGGAFNTELSLTQSFTAASTAETAGQVRAELKF